MYPSPGAGPESTRKYRSDVPVESGWTLVRPPEIRRKGLALGPRTWRLPKRLGGRDERGAEMVEFAFVVVLLIALLYGIISYGLVLAAQSTITQAAADAARSGIVCPRRGRRHNRRGRGRHRRRLDGQGVQRTGCRGVRQLGDHLQGDDGDCPSNANNTCLK